MITPKTAQHLIARRVTRLGPASLPIGAALGHVLAADVRSPLDLPPFDNSAMDGFALRSGDTGAATLLVPVRLSIAFTVHAGDAARARLRPGEACGIMTGARVPAGADAILPKELAVVQGSTLVIRGPVEPSRHIRRRGEDVRKGARVLKKDELVHPGTIAVLAAMGRSRVRVVRRPVVSVITTGDEAMPAGTRLARGQIYDSNSPMLLAMLKSMGIEDVSCRHVTDRPGLLTNAIRRALAKSDVLVVVGGVSVGDRDYLRPVLRDLGVKKVFWQVAQKPGKPLYFGVSGRRLVFGLPGNPASAFTCFYVYVYPALRRMSGLRNPYLHARAMRPSRAVTPDRKKWRLLKARIERGEGHVVTELPGQGSHMVTSLAATNSLVVVPPGGAARDGDLETLDLPYAEDP